MPPDFDVHDGRRVHATLSHELGHTLGLPDLYAFPGYTPDIAGRITGGWDLMAGSRNTLPHYSISNRMRMGWLDAGEVRLYDFKGAGGVNDLVTLHAAELGPPPPGRVRTIEIRLADGWNYYVEYRAHQQGQGSDTLPKDRRVLVTDVVSDTFAAPVVRPPVLLVHTDADGDGLVLDVSADFEDTDPGTQMNLRVTVVSTAADHAVVRVEYGADGRPDPGLRTWNGPPEWKSPDIEVRNAKTAEDPARWADTPWPGNLNTVVAKVRNHGDILAKNVTCDFFVLDCSTGEGPPARTTPGSSRPPPHRPHGSGRGCGWPTRSTPPRWCTPWCGSGIRTIGSSWSTSGCGWRPGPAVRWRCTTRRWPGSPSWRWSAARRPWRSCGGCRTWSAWRAGRPVRSRPTAARVRSRAASPYAWTPGAPPRSSSSTPAGPPWRATSV
ncbi:hypothetical protein ACIBIZ_20235 [Nonomuraea spiralis]|uniref:hypothetical protein n=1 Tax=Nonomuraea spiralis TaxID=46182 RepID=UPI0037B46D1E